jgi:hypothetical protein
MGIKTTVGQVALIGGGRYDQSSGILVDERASHLARGRSRGNLYVLAQVSGPEAGRDLIAEQVTQTVCDTYYGWRGSVTAGLQQAVRLANSLLFEENRNSLPGERRTAGVSCVVLRNDSLFVAQAGPAAVYLAQGGQVARYPDVSPWLDGIPLEEMDAAPLGERRDVNVYLDHTQVSSGDTVLLVDCELARCISSQAWPSLLTHPSVGLVLDELLIAGRGIDLSALAVRLAEEETRRVPAQPSAPDEGQKKPSALGQPILQQFVMWVSRLRLGDRMRTAGQTLLMALVGLWTAILTFLKRMVPGQVGPPETSGRQVTTVSKTGKRRKTRQRDRAAGTVQSDLVQRILIGVAVAIPLVVAVVVLVTLVQRGQSRKHELEALWQQAYTRWEQAEATSDQATSRTLLTEAQGFLERFLESQSDDPDAMELQSKIWARLDVINRVTRISLAAELNAYPDDADLTRVVVEGVHVFVLDRSNGRAYHHQLDEQLEKALRSESREAVLVSRGQQVGDVVVGDLVDMVWMPTGPDRQRASLVILESGGALLDYDPATGELVSLRLAASESWQFPKLVGSHTGRFYLLDSSANKIWRYNPTLDGYSAPPDEWLQTDMDLAAVVDIAIGDSIYLLNADGTIRRLTVGNPDTFDTQDWDTPSRNPAAIFTRPPDDTQWIYVADRGNERIVQCDKEGRFERQFRLTDAQAAEVGDVLADTASLFVDEISGNAYLLSGRRLYLLVLPMPG